MYTKTDIVLLCLFLFFLLNGWRRGFLRTILAPLCLLICTVIGVFIYDLTHNIVKAAAFVSVGTLVATLLAHILLGMAKRTVDPNYRDYCIWYSRLLGSLFGLAWEGGITVLIVISLTLAPMKLYGIEKVQDDVQRSFAFSLMEKKVIAQKEWIQNNLSAMAVFEDPQKMEELSSTQEFQDFFQDEKIQALADNQALVEHVQKGQLQKLLNDPQVTAIVRDDALMEKFMNFYYRVYKFALEEQKKQRPRE